MTHPGKVRTIMCPGGDGLIKYEFSRVRYRAYFMVSNFVEFEKVHLEILL